jgi:GNAT superfamily N-acetyltransferase
MLTLRSAERSDAAAIFTLIGELAQFERLSDQVTGAVADLEQHLFDSPRYAQAVLAQWDAQVVGFALYFFNYSTFRCRPGVYLEDLFVRPAYRGRGIGAALLREVERRARALGCARLEWMVLDWNQSAIDFYRRFGAQPIGGWIPYRKTLLDQAPLA